MYKNEINSIPMLYSESAGAFPSIPLENLRPFWNNLTEYNGLNLVDYSGNFSEILDVSVIALCQHYF